jgi:hypothetical protein
MAIVMPKQEAPYAEQGYVKLFLNPQGNLSSIDENGIIRTYAQGTNIAAIIAAQTESFSPTSQNILSKKIQLPHSPIPGTVRFTMAGCLDQIENQGFYLDGNEIKWDNMGLDGFLDETDLIQIFYSYYN